MFCCIISESSLLRSDLLPGANVTLSCHLNTFEGPGWCDSPLYQGVSLKWQDDNRPDYILAEQRISRCEVRLNVIIQRGSRFSCLALVNRQVQNRVEFPIPIRGVETITGLSVTHSLSHSLTHSLLGVVNTIGSCVLVFTRMIGSMFDLSLTLTLTLTLTEP